MASIKKELHNREIPKSGYNKFGKYKYHELSDFLSHIVELNEKYKVDDSIVMSPLDGTASLVITSWEDGSEKTITVPYGEAQMLSQGGGESKVDYIQRVGATVTYMRRYLYQTAYDIIENDVVDSMPTDTTPTATEKQVAMIKSLADDERLDKIIDYYKVKTLEALTATQASEAIGKLKK